MFISCRTYRLHTYFLGLFDLVSPLLHLPRVFLVHIHLSNSQQNILPSPELQSNPFWPKCKLKINPIGQIQFILIPLTYMFKLTLRCL